MKLRHLILLIWALCLSSFASAQSFPKLSGRVVDAANLLDPAQEADLTARLEALEKSTSRQLVVATVPSLEGYPIEDYGYRLGRAWGIGQSEANNGTILIVAPNEKKVRIEVGYGLEPIMTDALSSTIVQQAILPRFRAGDMAGGILAGTEQIIAQFQAPPEEAEKRAAAATNTRNQRQGGGQSVIPFIFWAVVLGVIFISMLGRHRRQGRYRGSRYGGDAAWPIVLWTVANEIGRAGSRGSDSWGGGGGWGGGGFGGGGGGFSGGGGSFGGGGASGSW